MGKNGKKGSGAIINCCFKFAGERTWAPPPHFSQARCWSPPPGQGTRSWSASIAGAGAWTWWVSQYHGVITTSSCHHASPRCQCLCWLLVICIQMDLRANVSQTILTSGLGPPGEDLSLVSRQYHGECACNVTQGFTLNANGLYF